MRMRPWDPAEHLEDVSDVLAYMEAAFEEGDPNVIEGALGEVAEDDHCNAVLFHRSAPTTAVDNLIQFSS